MSGQYATPPSDRPDEFQLRPRDVRPESTIGVYGPAILDAWLHRIGPTPTVVWMHLARKILRPDDPESAPVVIVADLAAWAGVSVENCWRAIDRLVQFGRCGWVSGDVLGVEISTHAVARREAPTRPQART